MSPSERAPSRPPPEPVSADVDSTADDLRPSADAFRASDIVLTEIAKLRNDGEYTKRDLGEMRTDVRDLRDRMSNLFADAFRASDVLWAEIAKLQIAIAILQTAGEYTKRELVELRTDVRDLRDRLSKLEVRVDHLPSKSFIVVVVTIALTIIGGLLSVALKLQSWVGAASVPRKSKRAAIKRHCERRSSRREPPRTRAQIPRRGPWIAEPAVGPAKGRTRWAPRGASQ
jgi:hypothetical protein